MCFTETKELSKKCSMICCALVPLPEANIASLIIIEFEFFSKDKFSVQKAFPKCKAYIKIKNKKR
jgi:hypothetical protein